MACTVLNSSFILLLVCSHIAISAVTEVFESRGSDWARDTDTQAMWHLLCSWSRMFSSFIVLFPMTNEFFLFLSLAYWRHTEQLITTASESYCSQPLETPFSPNLHFSQNFLFLCNSSPFSSVGFRFKGWLTPGKCRHITANKRQLAADRWLCSSYRAFSFPQALAWPTLLCNHEQRRAWKNGRPGASQCKSVSECRDITDHGKILQRCWWIHCRENTDYYITILVWTFTRQCGG